MSLAAGVEATLTHDPERPEYILPHHLQDAAVVLGHPLVKDGFINITGPLKGRPMNDNEVLASKMGVQQRLLMMADLQSRVNAGQTLSSTVALHFSNSRKGPSASK